MLSKTHDHFDRGRKNVPRVSLRWPTDTLPSAEKDPLHQRATSSVNLLTVHYHLHILNKTMDDLEDLCCSQLSLVFCQSVQPLDHRLHFLLANKFQNKLFFIHKSVNKFPRSCDDGLTTFSFLCLFDRQCECGEQFHENLDNNFIHGFCGTNLGIDYEAFEEVPN